MPTGLFSTKKGQGKLFLAFNSTGSSARSVDDYCSHLLLPYSRGTDTPTPASINIESALMYSYFDASEFYAQAPQSPVTHPIGVLLY
uniref:Uncharacterized protein n=1 Tax=Romanomermis culicivorax TaxID=13658 RepID=A0A915I5E0_ROMCU